jgi:arsenite oxidase small subunit
MSEQGFSRRQFIHLCSVSAATLSLPVVAEQPLKAFSRVQLRDSNDQPLVADQLEFEQEYIFFYPYVSTPCFLLRLSQRVEPVELQTSEGRSYRWRGGVGADHSVVSFAAICSHKLTHPSGQVSFIGYRKAPVGNMSNENPVDRRGAVIHCCSEHSMYDPAAGARVLSGPAPQPLTSIALDTDEQGRLYADGVYGGSLYERFFERFDHRLDLEFQGRAREMANGSVRVVTTDEYSRVRVQC